MPVGLAALATCWREQKTQMPTPQEIELRAQLARRDERICELRRMRGAKAWRRRHGGIYAGIQRMANAKPGRCGECVEPARTERGFRMTARKIVIQDCGECPRSDHKGAFAVVSRVPFCRKADLELPWTPSVGNRGRISAKREPGVPGWCPLPKDTDDAQELEQTSERFQRARMTNIQVRERAEFSASQWQQRAELAERQRDELVELMGDQLACPECGGDSIVSELQADGGGAAHYVPCTRCGGLGGIGVRRPARCPHCGGTGKEPA